MLNRLNKEMIAALKSGNKFRKTTLSTLIAAVKRTAIDSGCRDNITDEMVIQVLKKEKKSLVDAVEKLPDMPDEKKCEYIDQCLIIDEFVPQEISNERQIFDIIWSIAKEEGMAINKSNQGKFMKILKADYNVNMKVVSRVYKELIDGTSSH
jgi:uncharacterized protein YqeY